MPPKNNTNLIILIIAVPVLLVIFLILEISIQSDQQAKLSAEQDLVADQKKADLLFQQLQSTEPTVAKSTYDSLKDLPEKQKSDILKDMLATPVVLPGDYKSHQQTLKFIVTYQKVLDWTPEFEAVMEKEGQSSDIQNKACWIEYTYVHMNDTAKAAAAASEIMNSSDLSNRKFIIQYIIDHSDVFWPGMKQPFKNYIFQYQKIKVYKETVDLVQNFLDLDSKGLINKSEIKLEIPGSQSSGSK